MSFNEYASFDGLALGRMVRERTITPAELMDAAIARAEKHNAKLNAIVFKDYDRARDMALSHKDSGAPFAGVPMLLKDIMGDCAGMPTRSACAFLPATPMPADSEVVARYKRAGFIPFAKTNAPELGIPPVTESRLYGPAHNPWNLAHTPGGSSGGSAAAVASCQAPLALGTDTGGSIRQPAGMCGVVGLKPTYGRVSRFGLVAFASSLDQVGPFAHDVTDAALLLEVIAGHDPRDSTSVAQPVPPYRQTLEQPVKPLTIGVAREYFGAGLDPEVEQSVRAALQVYRDLGATVKDVSLPHSQYAIAVYYIVATAEASSNLARYDGVHYGYRAPQFSDLIDMVSRSRGEGFGPEVQRRVMLGTYALSSGYYDAYYLKAMRVRRLVKEDFDRAFAECDVVMGPTSPTAAFKIGERVDDPLAMYLSDIYTISANLAGIAGISVPCGFTKQNLPIGLQILAPPFAEEKLLRVARMFEKATDWHTRRAALR
jgi:aspartyl-tRNA(Asn)/glutamyl-tRNA(Gln) amidotransferase subunit A